MNLLPRFHDFTHPDEPTDCDVVVEIEHRVIRARQLLSELERQQVLVESMMRNIDKAHLHESVHGPRPSLVPMWMIAIFVGVISTIPVLLIEERHPEFIMIPIVIGALLVIAHDFWEDFIFQNWKSKLKKRLESEPPYSDYENL